jgi:hypothetical protein
MFEWINGTVSTSVLRRVRGTFGGVRFLINGGSTASLRSGGGNPTGDYHNFRISRVSSSPDHSRQRLPASRYVWKVRGIESCSFHANPESTVSFVGRVSLLMREGVESPT